MEDHVIFKVKFSLTLYLFKNLNQPPDPRNYVPTNVPIFMNPRKLGPTKINDSTVDRGGVGFVSDFTATAYTNKPIEVAVRYTILIT